MIILQESPEIYDYFNWNQELLEIEKSGFTLFLEDILGLFKANNGFKTEDILKRQYFQAKTFKELELEFKESLEKSKSNSPSF